MRPHTFLIGSLVLLSTAAAGRAHATDEPTMCERMVAIGAFHPSINPMYRDPEENCRRIFWRKFQWRPLGEVLTPDERRTLDQEIDRHNCKQAAATLSDRFVAAHPSAPSLKNEQDYRAWRRRLGAWYPALGTCLDVEDIRELQTEIERSGQQPAPYTGLGPVPVGDADRRVFKRDLLLKSAARAFSRSPGPFDGPRHSSAVDGGKDSQVSGTTESST